MTETMTPRANRLTPPSWRDSRLLVGVLLVLVATGLGAWVIARADDTTPVYAAKGTILPGQALTSADLVVVDVRIGEGAAAYLPAVAPPATGSHALRGLEPGELIPAAAVGTAQQVLTRAVTLQVDPVSVQGLGSGSVVDVWVNRPQAGTTTGRAAYQGPERLHERVVVAKVAESSTVLGSASGARAVSVLVPVDKVGAVVGDVDAGARMTLVSLPGVPAGAPS